MTRYELERKITSPEAIEKKRIEIGKSDVDSILIIDDGYQIHRVIKGRYLYYIHFEITGLLVAKIKKICVYKEIR